MAGRAWIGIAAICFLGGCASVRGTTTTGKEKPAPSSSADESVVSEKSDSRRFRSRIRNLQPPGERIVTARKVSLAPNLTTDAEGQDDDEKVEVIAPSSPVRFAIGRDDEADSSTKGDEEAGSQSVILQTADDDAADKNDKDDDSPVISSATAEAAASLPVAYPLTLDNVLYLADAQNPNVAFARERINEAYARVDRAQALWLPSIRAGMNYVHHEGNVQDVVGNVFSTNKSAFYGGMGAAGVGSGSPAIPGLVAQFHLSDAIFQPRIAGQQMASRQFAASAARNDVLRNTALAYLELLRAEQSLAISEEALKNTHKLAELTGNYARTGQGLRSDYERMLTEQAIREAEVVSRVEGVRVTSARLAQLLHADASIRISSNEPVVVAFDLFDGDTEPQSLVATALMRRPELSEQKHLVCEAVERLKREKYAPLVPSVLLGMSYGAMGGGLGNSLGNTNDRWDADAVAFWEIRNMGIGERAARNETSSLIKQSQQRELATLDLVAREVVEAQAQVSERQKRINISKKSIIAAERSYQLNVQRIENAQGLPIETLQSVQALALARQTYLNAVVDYNIAQFELCRAVGWFETT